MKQTMEIVLGALVFAIYEVCVDMSGEFKNKYKARQKEWSK